MVEIDLRASVLVWHRRPSSRLYPRAFSKLDAYQPEDQDILLPLHLRIFTFVRLMISFCYVYLGQFGLVKFSRGQAPKAPHLHAINMKAKYHTCSTGT